MKEYLAIFDLDGTLFDTSEVNYFAYKDALMNYDIKLERDYFYKYCMGKHYKEFLPLICGGTHNIEEIHRLKKQNYIKNIDKAKENIHLFNIIKGIHDTYDVAIVTTASRQNVMDILNHFGCVEMFDLIITQENMTKMKPDPQGFLIAMKHFEKDKEKTVIYEDSEVGIAAARATGATVIVVDKF